MNWTKDRKRVAKALSKYHHRAWVPAAEVGALVAGTLKLVRKTEEILAEAGYVELCERPDHPARLTSSGRAVVAAWGAP